MGNRYILVLDAGTTGPRCLVFDHAAQVVGFRARQWSYMKEEGAPSLARAFDPQALWRDLCQLIAEGLKDAQAQPRQLAAVSITSQRQGVVFLDDAGRELYAGPNLDLRAVFEGAAIDEDMGDRVYQTTGRLPSFFFTPAKLRWFQLHRPGEYARIACVLTLADWLAWRLTGVGASEPTLAGEAGLLDIHRRDWCKALLSDMGLLSNAIPLVESGTALGSVGARSAEETGLAEGTPVVVGGADTQCGLLGMGVARARQVGIVAGWSAPLQMLTTKPVLSPEARTWAGCFLERDKWVLESNPGDVGNSYQWLANTLFESAPDAFGQMDALASAAPPGSDGALAFLGPSRMDMTKVGMRLGGLLFPVPLTFSDLGRGHLVRSALEAAAFAIRANLEQVEGLARAPASNIAVGGGMTRTRAFVRILTDVIGREVKLSPIPQVSALGAYLCARVALGDYGSLHEAAASVVPRLQTLSPGPADSAEYEDLYQRWAKLSQELERLSI
jgi:autoinducer 2 (AI-2) kinase